ncbi:hypothetical protein EDD16DRAFT_1524556 [Pisolithus croceorrhizus]|nr:hypothetical protein EDD16DRAFT_1524556 [Pisolithus croceorrhizus]
MAYLNKSTNVGHQGCESRREVDFNMGMNTGAQDHKSKREVQGCMAYSNKTMFYILHKRVHTGSRTHYALDWGPGAALRLSGNLALPLRVVHTTVVLRGGEGALASGAETHLVEPFGSVAFDYPHPPRVAGLDLKEDFNCH